ncbi:MAG: hypothetical protein WCO93_00815 [bacterium]
MKTFFSILSAPIRPESGEQIALGLIMSDGEKSLFDYSLNKLGVIKSLVGEAQHHFIKKYLRSIENVINRVDVNDLEIIPWLQDQKNVVINEPYIEYLSVYNRNVLSFSKPVRIDMAVIQENFNQLFEKFVDLVKTPVIGNLQQRNVSRVKETFIPLVSKYYTEKREVTPTEFPSIVIPVTIDLYGKNENIVFAQFIDMERSFNHIKTNYYDLKELIKVIPDAKSFLVSAEPEIEKFSKQHEIWDHIRSSRDFDYVDVSEVDVIREYAERHGVKPV